MNEFVSVSNYFLVYKIAILCPIVMVTFKQIKEFLPFLIDFITRHLEKIAEEQRGLSRLFLTIDSGVKREVRSLSFSEQVHQALIF